MAELVLSGITKSYGNVSVIKGLDLSISKGEFVSLLGSSGCGKSTTLAMIAGLEAPSSGKILFRDKPLASPVDNIFVEPEDRQFGVVFQSYALWPHMTVEQNLAFPLKIRRIAPEERSRRIAETLELVGLSGLEKRYPGQLSGGQQQRVGLARALVYRPQLLLLDEPLSNLDALLREQARVWLKEIQLRLGITTIYVTHDQTEALSLSDRIVVMKNGVVEQVGSPTEIYERPATPFVAEFVGSSNFFPATVADAAADSARLELPGGQTAVVQIAGSLAAGQKIRLSLRPERLKAEQTPGLSNALKVTLKRNVYVGERFSYECELDGQSLQAFGDHPLPEGAVELYFSPSSATIFAA
ncbi:ABC transporter ATP-binding protein [Rhizobiaceae bacterium BDR2-2]|uniref:ABC transporter ATP-binding protein n=1 Tax=Ectorhizobium quercum TaxID=2965071 RepID=A0AAE3N3B5_9HYPH|nr:ABC transporter ATP-binding protein [Ectorhizobium quercum]MCX8999416.1 ABC transporter ATP-binding protein [Ectorhizobium quercum]